MAVKFTTELDLLLKLRMGEAINLAPLYASMARLQMTAAACLKNVNYIRCKKVKIK